jgi:hypothetical protein
MNQDDLEIISAILSKYGLIDWTLIGFSPTREYRIFSYFTDPSVVPIFKYVLFSILKTIENNFEENYAHYELTLGNC